jgi:hypothetical protein
MDMQVLHGSVTELPAIELQRGEPFLVCVHRAIAEAGMQVGKVDAREDPWNGFGHLQHIRKRAQHGSLSADLRPQGDRVPGRAQFFHATAQARNDRLS